jgi:hypothetical protein
MANNHSPDVFFRKLYEGKNGHQFLMKTQNVAEVVVLALACCCLENFFVNCFHKLIIKLYHHRSNDGWGG